MRARNKRFTVVGNYNDGDYNVSSFVHHVRAWDAIDAAQLGRKWAAKQSSQGVDVIEIVAVFKGHVADLYEPVRCDKPPLGTGWVCKGCGREWSAMLGDAEVPEKCPDCGEKVEEGRSG